MKQQNKTETNDVVLDTRPKPISAKPNWHYDSYFLSQLERLNLRKPDTAKTKRTKNGRKSDAQKVDEPT